MGSNSELVIFFRVGVSITNINIGHLLINRKDYHKNESCSGNQLKFQHEFFFQLSLLHAYEKCFFHKPISQLARISLTLNCDLEGKFFKTRLEKSIGLHVKWTKYKDFKVCLEILTDFHLKFTKTYETVLCFLKKYITSKFDLL